MRVVGYVRVSTDEQGRSGLGLAAQRAAIEAECARRGWELTQIEEDVASGGSTNGRGGLGRALEACRRGEADGIVVSRLDRLSRSVADAARLLDEARRRCFAVVALDLGLDTSTASGELVANVMAAVAAVGAARDRRADQRGARGQARGRLGPEAHLPEAPARIRELHLAGHSQRRIAERLNAEGVPALGGRWHRETVRRVLREDIS